MIASLNGELERINGDSAVVTVNGIGFLVHMPSSTIVNLGSIGHKVSLLTHMIVREDSLTLYGFGTESERELFQILISVSGLSPRLALAMLSSMSVEQVASAIAAENINLLIAIPGIGKKMANRIVLELKEKIGAELLSVSGTAITSDDAEVVSALTSLGYSVAEASRAVANLPPDTGSLEEKIRLALQYFNE